MNSEEKKLMIKIATELDVVKKKVAVLEKRKPLTVSVPTEIVQKPLKASEAANKFFGTTSEKKGPLIQGNMTPKDKGMLNDPKYRTEVEGAQKMFTKAIKEFCEEFQIQEFNISFKDDTNLEE